MIKKIIVGDVGGTTTTLGIYTTKKNTLTNIKEYKTKDINLESEILNNLTPEIKGISLAVAGPIINGKVDMTNTNKKISDKNLMKKTKLDVLLINDFEALGYYVKEQGAKKTMVIGAGTGLGKVIVLDEVICSEGGHEEFPFIKGEEKLKEFFYKKLKRVPEYEDLISGKGLSLIKEFHCKKINKIDLQPKNIFSNKEDKINKKTIDDFSKFYGRFIKNSHVSFLTKNIFIAGGIVRKNPEILKSTEFIRELTHRFIKKPKLTLIRDKYAGLKGAGSAFEHNNI